MISIGTLPLIVHQLESSPCEGILVKNLKKLVNKICFYDLYDGVWFSKKKNLKKSPNSRSTINFWLKSLVISFF